MSLKAKILISSVACLILGLLSGLSSSGQINGWYTTIYKPSWTPPNWIFGPVWTILYISMGIAIAIIWNSKDDYKKQSLWFFAFHFLLNLSWSYFFFGMQMLGIGFIIILLMVLTLLIVIFLFYRIDRRAGYILIPYLMWISFAMALNAAIWIMNS